MIMSSRALVLFVGSLLAVSWAIQFIAMAFAGDAKSSAMTPWLVTLMFVPSLWSIGYLVFFNRKAWRLVQFWPGNPVYLVLAGLIPAFIALATLAAVSHLNWGASSYFDFTPASATVLNGPWVMNIGEQSWTIFSANVAATTLLFAFLNSPVAAGEEFGWRGVLQTHFTERFGLLRGVAMLGFIWAIWHTPMNLAGYNYAEAPILGAFVLFPIKLIAVSFVMAWITLRARSFWPAALMHGSGNGVQEAVVSSIALRSDVWPLAGRAIEIGVTIALALVCILLMRGVPGAPDSAEQRTSPSSTQLQRPTISGQSTEPTMPTGYVRNS
jgi:membrane protease YdiL (CAAX protease family)